MDIMGPIGAFRTLVEIGNELADLINKAKKSPNAARGILLYLRATQVSIHALGIERQRILSDVRKCDLSEKIQAMALWTKLDQYLNQDNVRSRLQASIQGLERLKVDLKKKAKPSWWRKKDKAFVVEEFMQVLNQLTDTLNGLSLNFLPGSASGMGVHTLIPIYNALDAARKHHLSSKQGRKELLQLQQDLEVSAQDALNDASHSEWLQITARVEALIVDLQLAFSLDMIEDANAAISHS